MLELAKHFCYYLGVYSFYAYSPQDGGFANILITKPSQDLIHKLNIIQAYKLLITTFNDAVIYINILLDQVLMFYMAICASYIICQMCSVVKYSQVARNYLVFKIGSCWNVYSVTVVCYDYDSTLKHTNIIITQILFFQ